jgi:hypothetical protein
MADEETDDWPDHILLIKELIHKSLRFRLMTEDERSALAKRFNVSEDLLLRYERAQMAYNSLVFDKQWTQAREEVIRRMSQLEKELTPTELAAETSKEFRRISAAAPENEISLELKEAKAAIMTALSVSASTSKK